MFGRTEIKVLLLMSVISVVVSCLVTNCPRGGKRGGSDFDLFSDGKKCKFCDPDKEVCSGGICSLGTCGDEGRCVAQEVCCTKSWKNLAKENSNQSTKASSNQVPSFSPKSSPTIWNIGTGCSEIPTNDFQSQNEGGNCKNQTAEIF